MIVLTLVMLFNFNLINGVSFYEREKCTFYAWNPVVYVPVAVSFELTQVSLGNSEGVSGLKWRLRGLWIVYYSFYRISEYHCFQLNDLAGMVERFNFKTK